MDRTTICTRLLDQNFGMCVSPEDILLPIYNGHGTNYFRPWKLLKEYAQDFGSTIESSMDQFRVTLDVQHFKPEEINVTVKDRELVIEAKHEERRDDHGIISRQFIRRYCLPKNCPPETVSSTLSTDGVLIITAKKVVPKELIGEKVVPIKLCGPSRKEGDVETKIDISADRCTMAKKDMQVAEIFKKDIKNEAEMTRTESEMTMKETQATKKETEFMKKEAEMTKKDMKMELAMEKRDTKTEQVTEAKDMKMEAITEMKEIISETQSFRKETEELEKKDRQKTLKEEHCRLLKPELLKDAASTTERLISESRKEADELLKLLSTDRLQASTSTAVEKLDEVIGQCKTAISELNKEKASESITTAEMSSFQSSMSETIETMESSSFTSTSMSSSMQASSATATDISEIICKELKDAAENI